jgi:hypothetical protein
MNFLYHLMPKNMRGNVLYPLNVLRDKYPEAYADAVKKYEGRDEVLNLRVPTLDCLWNDVLHMTAVEPAVVKNELNEAGGKINWPLKFFKIDPDILEPGITTVYLYTQKREHKREDFVDFSPDYVSEFGDIENRTRDYYRKEYSAGRKPLIFYMVPHILYRGSIGVSGLEVVEV